MGKTSHLKAKIFHCVRSKKFLQVAYISQEMLQNATNLTIMNEDLHVFIRQDLNPLG